MTEKWGWFASKDVLKLSIAWSMATLPVALLILLLAGGWRPASADVRAIIELTAAIIGGRGIVIAAKTYAKYRESQEVAILREQYTKVVGRTRQAERETEEARNVGRSIVVAVQTFAGDAGVGGAGFAEILQNATKELRSHRAYRERSTQTHAIMSSELERLRNAPAPAPIVVTKTIEEMGYQPVDIEAWLKSRRKGRTEGGSRLPQFMPETWRNNVAGGCRADGIVWLKKSNDSNDSSNPPSDGA